jgi:phosphatidylglycerol:prolipoprotein diacylglycerol transferase
VLPYIDVPQYLFGYLPIFGLLVASAVILGITIVRKRVRAHALDADRVESFINWMLLGGFAGAHIFDTLFYHPHELLTRPWSLLFFWEGLSSFGGLAGAAIGCLLWKKFRNGGKSILAYMDLIASVFPISWILGRLGCASVHDHKGRMAEHASWLTVTFPDGRPYYDLGILEMLYAIVISLVMVLLWRRPQRVGTYLAVSSLLYAPVRFVLDFYRAEVGPTGDARYLGFTPAQWACVALFVFGVTVFFRRKERPRPDNPGV